MLTVKNLSVSKSNKQILKNINLSLVKGQKLHITGESGSGKSTLLKALLYFEEFTGSIFFEGKEVSICNLKSYRQNFAYVGQNIINFDGLVKNFLHTPYLLKANKNKKPEENFYANAFKQFKLSTDILNMEYAKLSGGQKQRINIIQALALSKKIIVLDEVASALDDTNLNIIFDAILNNQNLSALIVSHRLKSTKITTLTI